MVMARKLAFIAGAGIGYLFGTKAGREQYNKIKAKTQEVLDRPEVHEVTDAVRAEASRLYAEGRQKLRERSGDDTPAVTERLPESDQPTVANSTTITDTTTPRY